MLVERLKLINYLEQIEIEESETYFFIRLIDVDEDVIHHLGCYINKKTNEIDYVLLDTSDCYENYMSIDMKEFNLLQKIIKELSTKN